MPSTKNKLWCEKYRPTNVNEYLFHDKNQKTSIERKIDEKNIPHLLFSGVQGSGKTSLAFVIINELEIDDTDVLTINASDENSVEVIRDKIKSFITTFAFGDFKVVHLEEADYITPNGQGVLRRMMEEYSDVARFILTCNYENKIIPAIKSRCQHYRFKAGDRDQITEHTAKILINEGVKFDLNTLDDYISAGYPDVRKIINLLQQYTVNSSLMPIKDAETSGDYKFKLLEKLSNNDWNGARVVLNQIDGESWEEMYSFLYQNLHKCPKFNEQEKRDMAIIIIADYMNSHVVSSDPELNATAMFIKLSQI